MNIKDLYLFFMRKKIESNFSKETGVTTKVLADAIICNHYIVLYKVDDIQKLINEVFGGIKYE